ncbi:response regulator [Pseudorhodoferax aquiterrae]|nr:response regulator [Pseudorhodoferax aquiterrae]
MALQRRMLLAQFARQFRPDPAQLPGLRQHVGQTVVRAGRGIDGHAAHTAHSGAQALQVGAGLLPNVVLMDIGMPFMSGHEACRRMRQQPWGRGIPIIALTGLGQHANRQLTEQAGFDAHLVKPVDMAVLRALLSGGARKSPVGGPAA